MSDHSGKWNVPKLEMAVVAGLLSTSVTRESSSVIGDEDAAIMWSMKELVPGLVMNWSCLCRTKSAMELTQPIVCE